MSQRLSPFKFLDAYQEEDRDVFFGREEETEALYDALSGVKHLLIYGPSGAGKTSLVECGLRNQFSDADWYAITIRRRKDINASVFAAINQALEEKIALDAQSGLPFDGNLNFGEAIEQLFNERYQPIYLLFDQFEELLLLGDPEEKMEFFTRLNALIRFRIPCRVILIMREEFIGHLSEFEPLCPSIFKHRFRLEKMGRSKVRQVILQILEAASYQNDFQVADSEGLTDTILSKLPDQRREIELTHVQVFLGELWNRAQAGQVTDRLPVLRQELIRETDNLESVLDAFLKKQLQQLERPYGEQVPLELLAAMVSERATKLQLTEQELKVELAEENIELPSGLLADLEVRRIVRTLKTDEEIRYELSHDLLAYVVSQNLTEEIQLREKANEIYRVYHEREGHFAQADLDYLRPYRQYKDYPPKLAERIQESEAYLQSEQARELQEAKERAEKEQALRGKAETNQRIAQQRTKTASVVAVVALIAAIAAGVFFQRSTTAQAETLSTLEKLQRNQKIKAAEELRIYGDNYVDLNEVEAAKEVYRAALDSLGIENEDLPLYESLTQKIRRLE